MLAAHVHRVDYVVDLLPAPSKQCVLVDGGTWAEHPAHTRDPRHLAHAVRFAGHSPSKAVNNCPKGNSRSRHAARFGSHAPQLDRHAASTRDVHPRKRAGLIWLSACPSSTR